MYMSDTKTPESPEKPKRVRQPRRKRPAVESESDEDVKRPVRSPMPTFTKPVEPAPEVEETDVPKRDSTETQTDEVKIVEDEEVKDEAVDPSVGLVYKPVYCHHYTSVSPRNTSLITMKLPYKDTMMFVPNSEYIHCMRTQIVKGGDRELHIENARAHKYMVVPQGELVGYVTPIKLIE